MKFSDENMTFSMYYHMKGKNIGTLRVYLDNETDVFRRTGKQSKEWNYFETTTIPGSQHVRYRNVRLSLSFSLSLSLSLSLSHITFFL